MDEDAHSEVLRLLERAPKPPKARPPEGATRAELDALQRQVAFPLPASLRRWLALCNGYHAGPGGLFGARPDYPDMHIASIADLWSEEWSERWLPIAGDGCGDYYIVDASVGAPVPAAVYFIDCSDDPSRLTYAVGSSIPRFLIFLLERELGDERWPFDATYVLARDPAHGVDRPSIPAMERP